MPLYQARQERVTHLQICLETPVCCRAVALVSSRAASLLQTLPDIASSLHFHCCAPARRLRGNQPSTPVLPHWTSLGESALTGASNLSLAAAAGSIVCYALPAVPTNERSDCRLFLLVRARPYPNPTCDPQSGCRLRGAPALPLAYTALNFRPVRGRSRAASLHLSDVSCPWSRYHISLCHSASLPSDLRILPRRDSLPRGSSSGYLAFSSSH